MERHPTRQHPWPYFVVPLSAFILAIHASSAAFAFPNETSVDSLSLAKEISAGVTADLGRATLGPDGEWICVLPAVIDGCTAVYDPNRDRVIIIGQGDHTKDYLWECPLHGTPLWSRISPTGIGPLPSTRPKTAVFDPVRDRLIVMATDASGVRFAVWALTFSGSAAWTRLHPTGTPPAGWFFPSAMLDPIRDRILVFGGGDGGFRNDTYALSLSDPMTWSPVTTAGSLPAPRDFHTATYDPIGDRMIIHGGANNPNFWGLFDTWALQLSGTPTWVRLSDGTGLPSGQTDHTAVYDPVGDRLVVFGGTGGAGSRNDVWALSLRQSPTWTQLLPSGSIPRRDGHGACYDPLRHRMIVYGGRSPEGAPYLADLWSLGLGDSLAWIPLLIPPKPRNSAAVALDSNKQRLIVFGGEMGTYFNDVWALDLQPNAQWVELHPEGTLPPGRMYHTLVFDPVGNRVVAFGGRDATHFFNDTWSLELTDPPRWTLLSSSGPAPRHGHVACYDPAGLRMLVFGGQSETRRVNDVWTFDLAGGGGWSPLQADGPPPSGRLVPGGAYDPVRKILFVFGGIDSSAFRDDFWTLSLDGTPNWTEVQQAFPRPSRGYGRYFATLSRDPFRDRILLYGGQDSLGAFNDSWEYSEVSGAWRLLSTSQPQPNPGLQPLSVFDPVRDRMLLFGVGENFRNEALSLQFFDTPTPVLASSSVLSVEPNLVRIRWTLGSGALSSVNVQRRKPEETWQELGTFFSDESGSLIFADSSVAPGLRYGYRVVILSAKGPVAGEETWVDVPAERAALFGTWPNPALANGRIAFTLSGSQPAELQLFTIGGRRFWSRSVGALGPGHHVLSLADMASPGPGLYLLRLTEATFSVERKIVILR